MAGDRHFHLASGASYIEKQEVTVQAGGNFYNGGQQSDGPSTNPLSPVEAFQESVMALIEQKIITQKQDFSVLYKLDEEMCLLGSSGYQDFADRVKSLGSVPDNILPNADSVRSLSFGSKPYPDWDFTGIKTSRSHVCAVANGYLREMQRRGYKYE